MKTTLAYFFVIVVAIGCSNELPFSVQPKITVNQVLKINATVRAMDTDSLGNVYFAGSNGIWGYTKNNGKNWHIDSITFDSIKPDFRSIAYFDSSLFLVSVYQPALVLKLNLNSYEYKIVHKDTSKEAFFDCISFNNKENGFLLGDPKRNCFNLFTSSDGKGELWSKVDCDQIPKSLEGEAPFAASNSNASYINKQICFVTGGKSKSRAYISKNNGERWKAVETPIVSGKTMTGIYSVDFYDENIGVIAGGNWDSISERNQNLAFTSDGGETWVMKDYNLPYISCVKYVPDSNREKLLLTSGRVRGGDSHIYFCDIKKDTCYTYPNDNYLSIKFANDSIAWVSGKNKIARLTLSK